jgi:hypothetical protein
VFYEYTGYKYFPCHHSEVVLNRVIWFTIESLGWRPSSGFKRIRVLNLVRGSDNVSISYYSRTRGRICMVESAWSAIRWSAKTSFKENHCNIVSLHVLRRLYLVF